MMLIYTSLRKFAFFSVPHACALTKLCSLCSRISVDLWENLEKISYMFLFSDVKKFIVAQVGLRASQDVKHFEAPRI